MKRPVRVDVICTDRGQHPVTLLGTIQDHPGGTTVTLSGFAPFVAGKKDIWLDGHDRVNIRCRRCRRHAQWTQATAADRLKKLAEAGVSRVDLSAIHG